MAISKSSKKLLAAIPFLNFCALLFLQTTDIETITKLLDILGLLSALLLVVVYATPGTVSLEELDAADVRFGYTPDMDTNPPAASAYSVWWESFFTYSPSFTLGSSMAVAGFCFSVVFFGVIFQYVYIGYAKTSLKRTKVQYRNAAWKKWYICNAIITVAMLILMVIAMVSFYLGIYVLCVVKFPDLGLALVQMMGTWYEVNIRKASDVYTDLAIFNLIVPIVVAAILVIGGVGNYFVYSNMLEHEDPDADRADAADAGSFEAPEKSPATKSGQVHPSPAADDDMIPASQQ